MNNNASLLDRMTSAKGPSGPSFYQNHGSHTYLQNKKISHRLPSYDSPTVRPYKRFRGDTEESYLKYSGRTSSEVSPPALSISHSREQSSSRSISPGRDDLPTPKYLLPTRKELDGQALSDHLHHLQSKSTAVYNTITIPLKDRISPKAEYVTSLEAPLDQSKSKTSSGSYHTAGSSFTEVLEDIEASYNSEDASFRTPDPFEQVEQLPLERFMDEVAVKLWEWVNEQPDRFELQLEQEEEDELEAGEYSAAEQNSPGCRVF